MSEQWLQYFSFVSSMYEFLDHESIAALEKAIWLGRLGFYDESVAIFENDLSEWMIVPVVVYEKAKIYQVQGKVRDAYKVLSSFIEDSDEDDLELPEYRLLALLLAVVEIHHLGHIGRACKEIDRTREWLKDVSVACYTDVQVAIVGHYITAETFLSFWSNLSRRENCMIPKPNGLHRRWAGLTDLREYLLDSGMLGEACFLIRSCNMNIYSSEIFVRLYRETLSRIPAVSEDANVRQKLLLINAQLRIDLLENIIDCEPPDRVQPEISLFEKELNTLVSSFGLDPSSMKRTSLYLRLCRFRIQLIPKTNLPEAYSQYMLVLRNYQAGDPKEITECYCGAALAAKALYQETGHGVWRRRFETLFQKKEEREFEMLGNILGPLVQHPESSPNSDFDFATMSEEEVQRIAEWYKSYDKNYPTFDIPSVAYQATSLKIRIYVALGDTHGQREELGKLEKWGKGLPVTLDAEPMTTGRDVIGESEDNQVDQETGATPYLEGGDPQMMQRVLEDLIREMVGKIESDSFWMRGFPGQAMLARWLKDDFRSGKLTLHELEAIFEHDDTEPEPESLNLPIQRLMALFLPLNVDAESDLRVSQTDSTSDTDLPSRLRDINAENIAEKLCGPFLQPISNELWLRRRVPLTSWLRRRSNVPQIRKDLVLISIYHHRDRQFVSSFALKAQSMENRKLDIGVGEEGYEGDLDEQGPSWGLFQDWIQRNRDGIEIFDTSHPHLLRAFPGAINLKMCFKLQIVGAFFHFIMFVWNTYPETDIDNTLRKNKIMAMNDEFIELSRELICFQKAEGYHDMLAKTRAQLATLLTLKIHTNITDSPNDLLTLREEGLQLLGKADDMFSSQLQRHRGSTIIEALWSKEDSRTFRAAHFVPQVALNILQLPDGFKRQDYALIWEWVQRSKAKALHSVMTWHQEQNSGENLNWDNFFSDITDVVDEKDKLISFADLDKMAKFSGFDNVAFVDWFSLPKYPHLPFGQIFMIIVKPGVETIIEDLGMTDRDVLLWKGVRLNGENLFQAGFALENAMHEARNESPLQDLRPLVKPLEKHTDPGSLLVFCPSNYLHQLPLHALELSDGTVMIHRNPIVYCYSLSVLRHNFLTALAADKETPSRRQVALFGDIAKDEYGAPYPAGHQAIQGLGDWFGVKPFLDRRATKSEFLATAPTSSLIHFHTHVHSLKANPLAHSIFLSADSGLIPELMPDAIKRHPWSSLMVPNSSYADYNSSSLSRECITAGEISNLINLPSPCHVTMMGCGGGRLRVHPGDEVMGLIPAFMMKGATSCIATLWNILDLVGANFTRDFYKSLKVEADKVKNYEEGTGLVNMAKAFQAAIIAMDSDKSLPPVYWAAFVLHGWWMYKPPLMTEKDHPWMMKNHSFD